MIKRWLQNGWTSLRRDRRRGDSLRGNSYAATTAPECSPITRRRAIALARALDAVTRQGATARAARLVNIILRRGIDHPIVGASVARRRLSEGQPEAALRIIETSPHMTAELRMLRAVVLVELGRGVEAHADLHAWSGSPTMPDAARVLLAERDWSTGGALHARRTMEADDREGPSVAVASMRLLADIASGTQPEQCRAAADAIHARSRITRAAHPVEAMIRVLGLGVCEQSARPTAAQAEQLARELAGAPDALPMLIAAQEIQPREFVVRLLMDAIEIALPRFADTAMALEALARLSRLIDDTGAAQHWANRAVEVKSAFNSTALLADEIEGRESAVPLLDGVAWAEESIADGSRAA